MASVPTVPTPSVAPSTAPLSGQAPLSAFGAADIGAGLADFGKSAEGLSDTFAQHAVQLQSLQNKATADAGFVQTSTDFATQAEKFKGEHLGSAATVENVTGFIKGLEAQRSSISAKMPNPMAQSMYDETTRRMLQYTSAGLASWAASEMKSYQNKENAAAIDVIGRTQTAENFDHVQDQINQQIAAQAALEHWGPNEFKDAVAKVHGANAYNVTAGVAPTDPEAAQAFYTAHKEMMTPQQRTAAENLIRSSTENITVAGIADEYTAKAAGAADVGKGIAALTDMGATVTSGARTPEHNAEVGGVPNSYHLIDQARDLVPPKGMTLAELGAAARKSVPGAKVIVEKDHVHVQWEKGTVPGAGTVADRIDAMETHAQAGYDAIAQDPRLHGNPVLINRTQSQYLTNIAQARALNNLSNSAAKERLVGAALSGGITDPATLQRSYPGALEDWNALGGVGQHTLTNQLLADGNRWDPQKDARYNQLVGMRENAPQAFLGVDMSKEGLPMSAVRQLSGDQQKIIAKQNKQTATNASLQRALGNEFVKQALRQSGIHPNTPEFDHFTGTLFADLEGWSENHPGKKPNDQELGAIAASVLAKRDVPAHWIFGATIAQRGAYEIPPDAERDLTAQFTSRYGRAPTNSEVAYFYRRAHQ